LSLIDLGFRLACHYMGYRQPIKKGQKGWPHTFLYSRSGFLP
jgi:hypothetical protein